VTAVDVDRRVVHMAYIQFALMHIPALVIKGDILRMEFREEWATCAHVLGGWAGKLRKMDDAPEAAARFAIRDAGTGDTPKPTSTTVATYTADMRGQLSLFLCRVRSGRRDLTASLRPKRCRGVP